MRWLSIRRGRQLAAGLAVAVLIAGCGTSGIGGHGQAAALSPQSSSPRSSLEQPSARCGAPAAKAAPIRFKATDGTTLDGVLAGQGSAGVVLVHEYPADLCGFWPFAVYLSRKHLQVLDIDLRCFGRSACPSGSAHGRVIDDIAGAVAELRHRGAQRIALVGASMGGAAVLIAGARLRPRVAAVVALSAEENPTELVGIPLNAGAAISQLTVPTMFVVATGDPIAPVSQTRAMYRATKARDKDLEVLSGTYGGEHGWDLLSANLYAPMDFTPVTGKIGSFITSHTRG